MPIKTEIQTRNLCHFHLLDCPNGFQRERHERIGQSRSVTVAVTGKPVAPEIAVFRTDSKTLLAPSFLLSQDRENTFAHTSLRFSELEKRDQALERLLPVIKVKTLILTQVSLPLVQLWDGRLELSAFQSTLRI